ncbi:MAG: peptidoglycan-binding protein [Spirochaetes bacterium]|nr:peptidoglycan-binding protein [Spirochaetota bacterium]MBU0955275.1 peptidoglycan-binding protein [Spirochaetota bacterium]
MPRKLPVVLPLLLLVFILSAANALAQNLSPDDELYLADPKPRFNGEQVKTLQRFLLFQGIDIGADGMDGWFGRDTRNALLEYQSTNELEPTGRIRIRDFSAPLVWAPHAESFLFSGWPEGPFPGDGYYGEVLKAQPGRDFVYSSYFGTITISAAEISANGYSTLIHSPEKRFLAAFNDDKSSVSVWDILSGTKLNYPIEATAKDSSYQYKPDEHTRFAGETITWWMNPMKYDYAQLSLVISFTYLTPSQDQDRSLIIVSPYIQ